MTDLLTTLTQRTLGTAPVAEPTIAPRFAPSSEIQEPMTRETPVVPQETETSMTDQFERSVDTEQSQQINGVRNDKTQSTVVRHEDTPPTTQGENLLRPQTDQRAHLNVERAPSTATGPENTLPTTAQGVTLLRPQADNAVTHDDKVPSTVVRRNVPPSATTQGENLLRPQTDQRARLNAEPAPEHALSTVTGPEDTPPATAQGVTLLRPQASTTPSIREQTAWLPTTIETTQTGQAPPTADQKQQPRRETLKPKPERFVDTPAPHQTRVSPQPLDEAQPSTEDALLVRPRLDRYDQQQSIRDQHQIEPHPVAEVAADDMTDALRTAKQPTTEPAPAPTIQVSIGRIDVRAKTPNPPPPQATPARPQPSLSLDDYLKQRNGGRP